MTYLVGMNNLTRGAVFLLAVVVWAGCSAPPEAVVVRPQRQKLISYLTTNGRVEPTENFPVFAETTGRIVGVPVREGDQVAKGALLASIDDAPARSALEQARARLVVAEAELPAIERGGSPGQIAELESGLDGAKRRFDEARREVEVIGRLVEKDAVARVELERAEAEVETARAQADLFRKKLDVRVGPEEHEKARARIRDAKTAVTLASEHVGSTVVRSPISGLLYSLAVRAGDYVTPGTLLASVGNIEQVKVVVLVDEPELGRVKLGDSVMITSDAYAGTSWQGRMDRLPSEIVSLNTRRVGEVWCRVDNADGKLIPNLRVNVQIETAAVDNALTLRRDAVVRRDGDSFVWLLGEGEKVEGRTIDVGISSTTDVEILSGLNENDAVVLPSGIPLEEGQVVQPTQP